MIKPIGLETERFLFKITMHEMSSDLLKEKILQAAVSLKEVSNAGGLAEATNDVISTLSDTIKENKDDLIKLTIERDAINVSEYAINTFYLPMPNSMTDEFSQSYEDNSFNLAKSFFDDAGKAEALNYVNNKMDSLARRSGLSFDPNVLSVYVTSDPRQIQCNWKIIPRSKKEYDSYVALVDILKDSSKAYREAIELSSGSSITTYVLKMKYLFTINIITQSGDETLTSLLLAAGRDITEGFFITNVTTTLGNDQFQTLVDGSPKEFSLQVTFRERKPIWREDWAKKYAQASGETSEPAPLQQNIDDKYSEGE